MREFAAELPDRVIGDQVVGLALLGKGAFQQVVVVGGDNQLVRDAIGLLSAQHRGDLGEELVQLGGRVVAVEQAPQLVVQRVGAKHQADVLRDPYQVLPVLLGVVEQ